MSALGLLGAMSALLLPPSVVSPARSRCFARRCDTLLMNDKLSMASQTTLYRTAFENKHRGSNPSSRKARREKMQEQLEAPRTLLEPDGAPEDDPSAPLALAAVRAADDRKAGDIVALRVGHLTSAASFFVNVVGRSKAQINAIVKHIEDELGDTFGRYELSSQPPVPLTLAHILPHTNGHRKASRQGTGLSGWVCLDYNDVVVNVMSEKERRPIYPSRHTQPRRSSSPAQHRPPPTSPNPTRPDPTRPHPTSPRPVPTHPTPPQPNPTPPVHNLPSSKCPGALGVPWG